MLVLTRKVGERIIMMDGDIEVEVLSCRGDTVRLGIAAPRSITVDREEVHKQKKEVRNGAESNNSRSPS